MAKKLFMLWQSVTATEEQANLLADTVNIGLSEGNHVVVVEITKDWYSIVGNERAKQWYSKFEQALYKEQLADL